MSIYAIFVSILKWGALFVSVSLAVSDDVAVIISAAVSIFVLLSSAPLAFTLSIEGKFLEKETVPIYCVFNLHQYAPSALK